MIKAKALAIAMVFLCMPLAAYATVEFDNAKGTLEEINGGTSISSSNSVLTSITGLRHFNDAGANGIGAVTFTTGALTGGSLENGGIFAAGGVFNVTANNGVIFNGTFSAASWSLDPNSSAGNWLFTLSGTLSGIITIPGHGDMPISAATVQISAVSKNARNPFRSGGPGKINLGGGSTTTSIGAVPEVDTLSLLGIGLLGTAVFPKISRMTKLSSYWRS
jgi:hypothetical protein